MLQVCLCLKLKEQYKLNLCRSIRPGGWIEQLEMSPDFLSNDRSLPPDSLAANLGKTCVRAAARSGRTIDLYYRYIELIEKAGFTDIYIYECK